MKQRAGPVPQPLDAATQIVAEFEVKAGVNLTTIDNPFGAVDKIVTPGGTVHVYDVAVGTAAIEYVTSVSPQTPLPGPVIDPG